MKNAANVIPGQFEAKGHDYRADLARFIREVYGLPATDDQLAAVEQALRASELERRRVLETAKAAATSTRPPWRSTLLEQRQLSATSLHLSQLNTIDPIRNQSSS